MANPAPSSSLNYLCSLLTFAGLRHLSPELLLLAAKNDPSATDPLLSCLLELMFTHLSLPSTSTPLHSTSIHSSTQPQSVSNSIKDQNTRSSSIRTRNDQVDLLSQSHDNKRHTNTSVEALRKGPMDQVDETQGSRDKFSIVKFYLALWGYPPKSPLFGLPCETKESRQLLFALGWLVSHCDSFRRALEKRWSLPAGGKLEILTDVHSTSMAIERGRVAQAKTEEYVRKVTVAANNLSDSRLRLKTRADQLLMLYGRVRTTMRTLHALISCKAKRIHEINHIQISNGVRTPYGQFQLQLLEEKPLLDNHLQMLEDTKLMIQKLEECDKHEVLFWQWMGEVATDACLHKEPVEQTHVPKIGSSTELASILGISEKASEVKVRQNAEIKSIETSGIFEQTREVLKVGKSKEATSTTGICKRTLMPVLNFLRQQLSIQRKSTAIHRRSTNAPKYLHLQTIASTLTKVCNKHDELVFSEFLSSWRRSLFVHGVCRDDEWSADNRIQSLKDIAMSMAAILAKIRADNRSQIEEALRIPMENENNLFAGL